MDEDKKNTEEEITSDSATQQEETNEEAKEESKVDESKADVSVEGKKDDDHIDYKAELERTKKQLSQAEYKLYKKNKEEREVAVGTDSGDSEVSVDDIVRKASDKVREEMAVATIESLLAESSQDPDERELIKYMYENRIVRTGYTPVAIREDIASAKLLANKPRIEKRIGEISRAAIAEGAKGRGSTSGQRVEESSVIKLTPLEERILARQGLTAKDVQQ